jgi:hypothetical protein
MPTTSNFGWTTPADTDLVKDGAAAIRTLGNGVDASLVDLKGGTTGQVLSKASNTDLDFTWTTDATGIPATIVDAKGDIIAATAADTVSRLAVGANDTVLTADSSTATGLKWATPSTGDKPNLVAQRSGNYIKWLTAVALGQVTLSEDVTYYLPIYLPGYAVDRISIQSGSSHSGTSTIRLGLYNASSTTGLPSTVYLDAGTVSVSAQSTTYEITISSTPPAGYYYFAINAQTITGSADITSISNATTEKPYPSFLSPVTSTLTTDAYSYGFSQSGVTGAFATAGTLTNYTGKIPLVGLRIA